LINLFYFNGKFSNSSAPKTKEKADYAECTSMAFNNFNFEFLLVIQDDVVAKENALKNIIKVKNDEITNFNLIIVLKLFDFRKQFCSILFSSHLQKLI